LDSPIGIRPVVLVSREGAYLTRQQIIVAPVSTRIRGITAEVPLGLEDALPRPLEVNLDVLYTINKSRLRTQISSLSSEKMEVIDDALRFALDLLP
jgi:mRNA interferase MazF